VIALQSKGGTVVREERVRAMKTDKNTTSREKLDVHGGFNRESVEMMVLHVLKIVEDMGVEWERNHNSEGLRDKFGSLASHLDYLKRYCEGNP
jgi:hypothetical protein